MATVFVGRVRLTRWFWRRYKCDLCVRARLAPILDNGFRIENQATVNAGFGIIDPMTRVRRVAGPDCSDCELETRTDFQKTAVDANGGDPQPGDRVLYAVCREPRQWGALGVDIIDPIPEGLIQIEPLDGAQCLTVRFVGRPSTTGCWCRPSRLRLKPHWLVTSVQVQPCPIKRRPGRRRHIGKE